MVDLREGDFWEPSRTTSAGRASHGKLARGPITHAGRILANNHKKALCRYLSSLRRSAHHQQVDSLFPARP